jgi:uncharacterized protein
VTPAVAPQPSGLDALPLPVQLLDAQEYWAGCRDGRLLVQHCSGCDGWQFYPRVICAACGSVRLTFTEVSGRAVVHSFTVCHRSLGARFAARTPYVVALVDMAEGPRMMTNIVGCEPGEVTIGMPVRVGFETVTEDVVLPVFEPDLPS